MADISRVPHRDLRVADTDRDAAAQALGEHFAIGRLDREEYDERLSAAWQAKTYGDLDVLFRDLPRPHPGFPAPAPTAASTSASTTTSSGGSKPEKQVPAWRAPIQSWGNAAKTIAPALIAVAVAGVLIMKGPGILFILILIGCWTWIASARNPRR